MKGYLRPFQRIVRLYRDSNLRRDDDFEVLKLKSFEVLSDVNISACLY